MHMYLCFHGQCIRYTYHTRDIHFFRAKMAAVAALGQALSVLLKCNERSFRLACASINSSAAPAAAPAAALGNNGSDNVTATSASTVVAASLRAVVAAVRAGQTANVCLPLLERIYPAADQPPTLPSTKQAATRLLLWLLDPARGPDICTSTVAVFDSVLSSSSSSGSSRWTQLGALHVLDACLSLSGKAAVVAAAAAATTAGSYQHSTSSSPLSCLLEPVVALAHTSTSATAPSVLHVAAADTAWLLVRFAVLPGSSLPSDSSLPPLQAFSRLLTLQANWYAGRSPLFASALACLQDWLAHLFDLLRSETSSSSSSTTVLSTSASEGHPARSALQQSWTRLRDILLLDFLLCLGQPPSKSTAQRLGKLCLGLVQPLLLAQRESSAADSDDDDCDDGDGTEGGKADLDNNSSSKSEEESDKVTLRWCEAAPLLRLALAWGRLSNAGFVDTLNSSADANQLFQVLGLKAFRVSACVCMCVCVCALAFSSVSV
jgi:hypothetical protein